MYAKSEDFPQNKRNKPVNVQRATQEEELNAPQSSLHYRSGSYLQASCRFPTGEEGAPDLARIGPPTLPDLHRDLQVLAEKLRHQLRLTCERHQQEHSLASNKG